MCPHLGRRPDDASHTAPVRCVVRGRQLCDFRKLSEESNVTTRKFAMPEYVLMSAMEKFDNGPRSPCERGAPCGGWGCVKTTPPQPAAQAQSLRPGLSGAHGNVAGLQAAGWVMHTAEVGRSTRGKVSTWWAGRWRHACQLSWSAMPCAWRFNSAGLPQD
jgi:hypothetical protein